MLWSTVSVISWGDFLKRMSSLKKLLASQISIIESRILFARLWVLSGESLASLKCGTTNLDSVFRKDETISWTSLLAFCRMNSSYRMDTRSTIIGSMHLAPTGTVFYRATTQTQEVICA